MLPLTTGFKQAALDLLFPPYCIGCGREGSYICGRCSLQLQFIHPPFCSVCGRPLSSENRCSGCIGSQSELDGIRAPFVFHGLIRQAIHELKYNNLRAIIPVLAAYLYEFFSCNPLPGDILVPVPVHRKRLRERGYNQSSLLAEVLGKKACLPVVENCLVRTKYIAPQARAATAADRFINTDGAFTCVDQRLKGKHVILIDDVSTSGATLNSCAKAVKSAGALTIWGLVLALEL